MKTFLLLLVACMISFISHGQAVAPELVFQNPVLKSGLAKKQGAIYRFNNVAPGVDAEIRLKRFSNSKIVMNNIDNDALGWKKAFQPEFGLPGLVAPWQHWYIDFELTFYESGTNKRQRMTKVDLTALDVDGDGRSISEYVIFNRPQSIVYSTVSYLSNTVAGAASESLECYTCGTFSILKQCNACGGDGVTNSGSGTNNPCQNCAGSGKQHSACNHAFEGVIGTSVQGPVENFMNIDTLATQVMATYQYSNVESISFRYGAKSGSLSSNGAGIRLNSTWFRQFSLAPASTLPVKLTDFSAVTDKKSVTLKWTGYEENFSHYILQRSSDGKEFTDVALVFASGNSNAASHYGYKDVNVSSSTGTLYYRLQLVDKVEESVEYSAVRVIRLGSENMLKLTTYPNPVASQLKITLPSAWQGNPVMIEIFTASGTRMQSVQLGNASQTEVLDLGKLARGIYLVQARCKEEIAQQMVIRK